MIKALTRNRHGRMTTFTLAALLVASLSVACWAQSTKADHVKLHGAGSTFAAPLIKRGIDEHRVAQP